MLPEPLAEVVRLLARIAVEQYFARDRDAPDEPKIERPAPSPGELTGATCEK